MEFIIGLGIGLILWRISPFVFSFVMFILVMTAIGATF